MIRIIMSFVLVVGVITLIIYFLNNSGVII